MGEMTNVYGVLVNRKNNQLGG